MNPEIQRQREAPASVLRAMSPVWRLRRLLRDVRLLGVRFGVRHWRLQNRIDNQRLRRFVRCVRRLGWNFGLRYWRMHDGLKDAAGQRLPRAARESPSLRELRRQLSAAETRLAAISEQVRRHEASELGDRASRA